MSATKAKSGARRRAGRQECEKSRSGRSKRASTAQPKADSAELLAKIMRLLLEEKAVAEDLFELLLPEYGKREIQSALRSGLASGLLEKRALLYYEEVGKPEPPWYWLTRLGLSQCGAPSRLYYEPKEGERKHARGLLKVRRTCELTRDTEIWLPERTVAQDFRISPKKNQRSHVADGAMRSRDGKTVTAVEFERTGKHGKMLRENMEFLRVVFNGGALFFCTDDARPKVEEVKVEYGFDNILVFGEPSIPGVFPELA